MAKAKAKKTDKKTTDKKSKKMTTSIGAEAKSATDVAEKPEPKSENKSSGRRGRPASAAEETNPVSQQAESAAINQDKESSSDKKSDAKSDDNSSTIVINAENIGRVVDEMKSAGKLHQVNPLELKSLPTEPKPEPTTKPLTATSMDFVTPNATFNGQQNFNNQFPNLNSQLPPQPAATAEVDHRYMLTKYAEAMYDNIKGTFQFNMWGYLPMSEVLRIISSSNKIYKYTVVEDGNSCHINIKHNDMEENTPKFKFSA